MNKSRELEEAEVDDPSLIAQAFQQLRGSPLADDRQLHHVGGAVVGQRLGQQPDQVVDQAAAPVVERAVR